MKQKLWVNAYMINKGYGGPEEGGWWYTHGYPLHGEHGGTFFNRDKAYAEWRRLSTYAEQINKAHGPYGDVNSVVCRGAWSFRVQRHPPQAFPTERPHYE